MAQNLFERQHIHTALIHQRCCSMAQFVRRISFSVQPCRLQAAGDNLLHTPRRQTLTGPFGDKQRLFVHQFGQCGTLWQLMLKRGDTGVVQIHQPLFVAFAGNADGIIFKIPQINGDQLSQAHSTVEK